MKITLRLNISFQNHKNCIAIREYCAPKKNSFRARKVLGSFEKLASGPFSTEVKMEF